MRREFVIRRFLYYFGWTIGIGIIIFLGINYQAQLKEQANKNFELMPLILFATIFPVVIGLLLRIPKLIIEIKQNKPWTFDWIKFIAIGLPCFYFIAMTILSFSSLGGGIIKTPSIAITASPIIQTITGIVFGYILLDSLKKKE